MVPPCNHKYRNLECGLCTLYHTRPKYRALWGGPPIENPPEPPPVRGTVVKTTANAIFDWAVRGPQLWADLHKQALVMPPAEFPAWVRGKFTSSIPCGDCKAHWGRTCLVTMPGSFATNALAFAWTVEAHNRVNARLGKPEFALEAARGLYGSPDEPAPPRPPSAGVVVGSYGWPNLNELQIRTTRRYCGGVPVLIADDASPDADRIEALTRYKGVDVWASPHRRGHYAGDLSAFWKGLQWADRLGLRWLCKVSQRFVWRKPDWLADAVKTLEASGKAILMQRCTDAGRDLRIRSECVLVDVKKWVPHLSLFDREELADPTEFHLWGLVAEHFGGEYCEWPGMPAVRERRMVGTVWHCSHSAGQFAEAFQSEGLQPDADFDVSGRKDCPVAPPSGDGLDPAAARRDWPVEKMIAILEYGRPGGWPLGWHSWENTREAHIDLLERAVANPGLPPAVSGHGIVSCVSAKPGWSSGKNLAQGYFPGAWVLVKELRRLGCQLPVTFCHLGPLEFDQRLRELVAPLGVDVIDLLEWAKRTGPWRILNGWESKVAAVLACPYREVMFLDADNLPVRDPSYLFSEPKYLETGAAFWPDLPPYNRREWLPASVWANCGMAYSNETDFESGQFLVDKSKCWHGLQATRHMNEHSDWYYKFVYGDKSTFHLGFRKADCPYSMPGRPAGWNGRAIIQHDFSGRVVFQHHCRNKPSLNGYPEPGKLASKGYCLGHLAELRGKWDGRLWSSIPDGLAGLADSLAGRAFDYHRVNLGRRPMVFGAKGLIATGAAGREKTWSLSAGRDGQPEIALIGEDHKPTVILREYPDGVWRGRWLEYEKCVCELIPTAGGG